MNAKERRSAITERLRTSDSAISASSLAQELSVSRQIIVGDIALLRASGLKIAATARGYILENDFTSSFPYVGLLSASHSPEDTQDELYTIVDYGGYVIDVIVEHPIYGQLSGPLDIASRHDVDIFVQNTVSNQSAHPLSILTDGIHFHKVGCKSEEIFQLIKNALKEKGYLNSTEL